MIGVLGVYLAILGLNNIVNDEGGTRIQDHFAALRK